MWVEKSLAVCAGDPKGIVPDRTRWHRAAVFNLLGWHLQCQSRRCNFSAGGWGKPRKGQIMAGSGRGEKVGCDCSEIYGWGTSVSWPQPPEMCFLCLAAEWRRGRCSLEGINQTRQCRDGREWNCACETEMLPWKKMSIKTPDRALSLSQSWFVGRVCGQCKGRHFALIPCEEWVDGMF